MMELGKFHAAVALILGSVIIAGTCPILIMTFMNAPIDFWCSRPAHLKAVGINVSLWRTLSGQNERQSCNMIVHEEIFSSISNADDVSRSCLFSYPFSFLPISSSSPPFVANRYLLTASKWVNDSSQESCLEWEFDTRQFESTIAVEWGLICDNAYKLSIAQTVFFVGMTSGVFISGLLADRFGRKPILLLVIIEVATFGTLTAFANSYEVFLLLRFLTAQGAIGSFAYINQVSLIFIHVFLFRRLSLALDLHA